MQKSKLTQGFPFQSHSHDQASLKSNPLWLDHVRKSALFFRDLYQNARMAYLHLSSSIYPVQRVSTNLICILVPSASNQTSYCTRFQWQKWWPQTRNYQNRLAKQISLRRFQRNDVELEWIGNVRMKTHHTSPSFCHIKWGNALQKPYCVISPSSSAGMLANTRF